MKKIKKKHVITVIVIAALVAGGVYVKATTKPKEPVGVMVTTSVVEKKDIEESISLKAPLEGTESVELVSKLHYEVIQLNVKEGDKVTKGQVLAVLDSSELKKDIQKLQDEVSLSQTRLSETSTRTQHEKELAQLQLDDKIKNTQKEYDIAVKNLEEAKRQYDNVKELVDAGADTKENLALKEFAVTEAQKKVDDFDAVDGKIVPTDAELKAVENAGLSTEETDRKTIEANQNELARKREDLQDCQILSTIDGTVTRVNIKQGRFADETDDDKPMFVIEDIDNLQMKLKVSEYDIAKIKEGQQVEISADILKGQIAKGVIGRISPTGEQKENSTERVIPTQVNITEKPEGLIAGINATAKILIAKSTDVLVVPAECVVQDTEGNNNVYKVNAENKIEIIPVELGLENDLEIEIKSDKLQQGDSLVLAPAPDLTEGSFVTPMGGI